MSVACNRSAYLSPLSPRISTRVLFWTGLDRLSRALATSRSHSWKSSMMRFSLYGGRVLLAVCGSVAAVVGAVIVGRAVGLRCFGEPFAKRAQAAVPEACAVTAAGEPEVVTGIGLDFALRGVVGALFAVGEQVSFVRLDEREAIDRHLLAGAVAQLQAFAAP